MSALIAATAAITMSSREIAELTGKEHKNVLADIRNVLEQLGKAAAEFSATARIPGPNNSTRTVEVFNLPRREVEILLTGYSIPLRAKVIDRLHELEAQVAKPVALPTTFAEALRLAAELEEEKQRLALENERIRPAAEVGQAVGRRKNISVLDFARHLEGVNIMQVQNWLGSKGYLSKDSDGVWYVVGRYRDKYFRMGYAGPGHTQILVLEKGQKVLVDAYWAGELVMKKGCVPT